MSNRVIIDQTTNSVTTDQCPDIHNTVVVNNDIPSTIDVIENVTNILTVSVPGPQGPVGPQGPPGLGGDITGSQYYAAIYKSATGLTTGSLYQSGSFTSIRNATSPVDPTNPDILYVNGDGVDSYNLISAHGNKNSYLQINVQNFNNSTEASSDIVASADNGTENSNYIDMGINSSGFTNTGNVGGQNDAYVYSTGNDLYIGNASSGKEIIIFNGGLDAINQAKVWIHNQGTVGINTDTYNTTNPPSLQVNAPNDTTYNIAQFFGNTDNYAQVGITNANIGATASTDLALYNNIDYENQLAGFVDLGINSTNYVYNGVYPGSSGDAYLFTDSEHLIIGSISGSGAAKITLFAGGVSEFDNAKLTLYGNNQHQMTGSLKATEGFSGSLFGTASWALNALTASYAPNAISSSYPIAVSGSTLYSTSPLAGPGIDWNGNFNSIFLGELSGYGVANSFQSIFLGPYSGYSASNAPGSNFLGANAGEEAINANSSNFLGGLAGRYAINAYSSNFFGVQTGYSASEAYDSNFLGQSSGYGAINANGSNFLGALTGNYAQSASYSNLIGWQVGYALNPNLSIGRNNIVIGTNITLAPNRRDSINLGGLIFGSGSYFDTAGNPFSGSANGRVGINQPLPLFSLDVSGSGRYTTGLTVSSSLLAPSITGSLQGTASWALNAVTASYVPASAVVGLNLSQISSGSVSASVNSNSASFELVSGSTSFLFVSNSGNIGINTKIPAYKLDVNGIGRFTGDLISTGNISAGQNSRIRFAENDAWGYLGQQSGFYYQGSSNFPFKIADSSLMVGYSYFTSGIWGSGNLYVSGKTLIGTTTDISSSVLIISSTTQGFLLPRMTDVQRIAISAPAQGLQVYDTGSSTEGLWYYQSGSIKGWTRVLNDSGSQSISGSLTAASGFTGSLFGTSSWAQNAISASIATNAITASFGGNFTASNALINGTITAQTLLVQTITSSIDFVTGSTRFGTLLTNTHQFTGSVSITGSLSVNNFSVILASQTGSMSVASASLAATASYVSSSNVIGTVTSASYAVTASYALNSIPAFPFTGSALITGSLGITGSLNVGNTNIEYQENTNVTTGTWRVVSSEPTASYRAAFFDYVMFSGSVARAGTVYSVWSASYAEYYENYTGDVGGSTSGVTLQAVISGSNVQLQATSSNNSWTIRSLVRML